MPGTSQAEIDVLRGIIKEAVEELRLWRDEYLIENARPHAHKALDILEKIKTGKEP